MNTTFLCNVSEILKKKKDLVLNIYNTVIYIEIAKQWHSVGAPFHTTVSGCGPDLCFQFLHESKHMQMKHIRKEANTFAFQMVKPIGKTHLKWL